jgi:hypothetical protein
MEKHTGVEKVKKVGILIDLSALFSRQEVETLPEQKNKMVRPKKEG